MLVAFIIIIFVAFCVFAFFSFRMMLQIYCPACAAEMAQENMMIPVGGFLFWWCPECDSTFSMSDAQRSRYYDEEEASKAQPQRRSETLVIEDAYYDEDAEEEYFYEEEPVAPRAPKAIDDEFGGF